MGEGEGRAERTEAPIGSVQGFSDVLMGSGSYVGIYRDSPAEKILCPVLSLLRSSTWFTV